MPKFKIKANPTFVANVSLSVHGQAERETVQITFKHLTQKGSAEYWAKVSQEHLTDLEALDLLIESWDGFDAAYSKENLDILLQNYPKASTELFTAYNAEMVVSAVKN